MAVTSRKHLLPGWSCLPQDILSEILEKLLEPTDHVRCAVVCKEWHAVVKEFNQTTRCSFKVLPMLMIPSERKLYSISEQKVYNNFMLPEPCNSSKRSCGSSNAPGWLTTVALLGEHELSTTLVNVFSRDVTPICLPPLTDFNDQDDWSRLYFFPKVLLSADPIANPDSYVVVAIFDGTPTTLAFIKGRQTSWSYLETKSHLTTDAIFYKRQVYAVGHWGWISSFDVDSTPLREKLLTVAIDQFPFAHKGYLVETTKGDLLHVRRFLKQKHNVPPDQYIFYEDKEFWTESFKVYKVVFDERDGSVLALDELTSIGDEALFVGNNHSMCVLASNFSGCQPNSIYYTDDLIKLGAQPIVDDGSIDPGDNFNFVHLQDETIADEPSDMGIFNLEDGSISHHYSLNPWHKNIPPAIWIMPSFNGLS